jgi:cobalt-zinc-cadmium efflux system membrane fusion protein
MKPRQAILEKLLLTFVALTVCPSLSAEDEGSHDEHEDEEVALVMNETERKAAGISIGSVERRALSELLRLPGEVIPNAYRSAKIAPRITAQIVERHVRLGDHVEVGQHMVTLSSVEMAEAQGAVILADRDWLRVKALGREVVSDQRYTTAKVGREAAIAKVLAYGMTQDHVDELLANTDASHASGAFVLAAPIAGTVLEDDFIVGEVLEPGRVIFEISDETSLWVEARTSAGRITGVVEGTRVRLSPDQKQWRDAEVVQIHHRLDENTRTQAVRIAVSNEDDWLHPGQFVEVEIAVGEPDEVLAIPREAMVLLKGTPVVFRLDDANEFHPEPVTLGVTYGDWREVTSGLDKGDVVATAGTFYLKSLLLKSEIGDEH